jgi:hypothetical protein
MKAEEEIILTRTQESELDSGQVSKNKPVPGSARPSSLRHDEYVQRRKKRDGQGDSEESENNRRGSVMERRCLGKERALAKKIKEKEANEAPKYGVGTISISCSRKARMSRFLPQHGLRNLH